MGVSTAPVNLSHRRVCVAILILMGAYAGCVAVALSIALGMIGRGLDSTPMQVTELYGAMWLHTLTAISSGVGALVLRRLGPRRRRWPRLALLAAVCLLLASIDRITSICYPPPSDSDSIFVPHATRGWTHRRGVVGLHRYHRIRLNSLGVRGPDLPWRKAADEFRILFLGDSVTFGWNQHEQETFVSKCADIVRRECPSSRVRCINAGVSGYATWQQYDFLQDEGVAMQPDLVVLCFCFNDVTDLLFVDPDVLSGPQKLFSFSNKPHWSGIVRAVRSVQARRRWRNLRDTQNWETIDHTALREDQLILIEDRFRRASRPALDKAWNRALRDLEKVDDACRQRALPWVLMALPFRSQFEPAGAGVRPQDKLQAWAQGREVTYLDLLPAFSRRVSASEDDSDGLYQDGLHFSTTGNRFVASELVEFLAGQRLLPTSARREPETTGPP